MKYICLKIVLFCLIFSIILPTISFAEDESRFDLTYTSTFFRGKTYSDIPNIYANTKTRTRFAYLMFLDYCEKDNEFADKQGELLTSGVFMVGKSSFWLGWGYYNDDVVVCALYMAGSDSAPYVKWTGSKNQMQSLFSGFFKKNCTDYEAINPVDLLDAMKNLLN